MHTPTERAIHDFYKTLLTRGSKHGKPLSRTTVRTVHRVLMKALKDLNIAIDGVREPRKGDRETAGCKGVWTAQQAASFLAHHTGHRLYAAWQRTTTSRDGAIEKAPKGRSKRTVALEPGARRSWHHGMSP